jgi:hypothetical protein
MKLLIVLFVTFFSFRSFAETDCNYDWQLLYPPTGKVKNFLEKELKQKGYNKTDVRRSNYRIGVESTVEENQAIVKVVVRKLPNRFRDDPFYFGINQQKVKNLPFNWGTNGALRKAVKRSLLYLPKCK